MSASGTSSRWMKNTPLVLFLLAALVVLYHGPVLWGGGTYVFVDDSRFFYPLFKWGSLVWGSGHLPLWNPDMDCGVPYWADPQTACAYTPMWVLYAFFSSVTAFNLSVVLHQLFAAWGFVFFCRGKGLSPSASFVGALVFGFSLHVTCSSWTPPALFALAWIPWIFWAGEALVAGKRWAFPVVTAALGLQMAAGYPVMAYLTGFGLWAHLLSRDRASFVGPNAWVPRLVAAYALAFLYNLSWGLPFAEYFPMTNHGSGGVYYQALKWDDLASFFVPFPKGNPIVGGYVGVHFWVATYFMGWAVPFLLVWRVLRRRGGWTPVLLATVALWLSLGETAGLGAWLKHLVPGYALVIRSGFWIGLVVFFAALLVAEAVEDFSTFKGRAKPLIGWGLAAWVAVSLIPAVWAVRFTMPRSYYEQPPAVCASMTQPGRMLHAPRLLQTSSRLDGATIEAAYGVPKDRLYPDWPLVWGRSCAVGYNTIGFDGLRKWRDGVFKVSPAVSRSALDYLGVRYLVGAHRFPGLVRVGDAGGEPLSLNPTAAPPWFCAGKVYEAGKMQEDWDRLKGSGGNLIRSVFVEHAPWLGISSTRVVTVRAVSPISWDLELGPGARALLVSSEAADSGWKVRVDGRPRPSLLVDHAFRGVELLPADREVRWVYVPGSLRLGLFAALMSLGLWAASIAAAFRKASPGRGWDLSGAMN